MTPPQLAMRGMDRETAVRLAARFVPGYVPPPAVELKRDVDRPGHFRRNGATDIILRLLKQCPLTAREVAEKTGVPGHTVSSVLTKQEQAGRLKRDGTRRIGDSKPMIVYAVA